ncbi:helix-turn-helix domain-containing protein [Noviherbaspirillum saxi]|uniref:Helix-turn-helix domain-containing protein n=2 Tax=Noviherbaspirillum saxi TaxID=2320863 RepID=A0A3A3FNL5_9BURK|nr:helix-turn-helix domain-containing protein [Noviherbaspirillum saxi]
MPAGLFAFSDLVHAANRRAGRHIFEPIFVAARAEEIKCAHNQVLKPADTVFDAALDAILIPGCWAESIAQIEEVLVENAEVINALRTLNKSVMMWSYCTGVCLMAATGRLNGQKATVTWWLSDMMRKQYPAASWLSERTSIFNLRTATASGVNGYQLLAQELIEKQVSKEAYRDLTKLMVLPRPERTHHAFQAMNLIEQPDAFLRKLYLLTEGMPASEVTVRRLADQLGTTERTLARKVGAAVGLPVAAYLRRIKLNQVSERLILTSTPANTISIALGFSSDSSMRRMFKDLTGLTPAEYRQAYGRP